jgi:Flp pilus assembly pilin Flp
MKFKPTRISVKHPKRLIVVVSAVVFLALATYGALSYFHWQTYDQDSQKAATALKTAIVDSLNPSETDSTPTAQSDKVIKDFEKTYGSTPCEVSSLYSWQTVVPQAKELRAECDQKFASTLDVVKKLKVLSQFFKDETQAAALLTATLEATKAPTDYAAASTTWKAASESDQLSNTAEFKGIHTKFTEVATAISTAFSSLATAVKNEDKAAFDAASTELTASYGLIDELKTTVLLDRTKLIKSFVTVYEKL